VPTPRRQRTVVPSDPTQSPTQGLSERLLRPDPLALGSSPASDAAAMGIAAGMSVGPYKLLQLIGEGGFGSVFMAEQSAPVHRRVALKIIKLGMDTRQVIARFEAERQALAMMDHPNIARVLDAGTTDTGRPYFVMELVKGTPITKYADKERLTIPQRLDLFQQVCHAVQHAHTKGVMHRDLKPSNILVSTHDGKPFAKVIDFGIAKATDQRLTEKTLFTDFQAMIGTPEYMSPEQAEGSLDIDTRTDIYSLGVLLYELLCGVTPFDSRQLRSAAYGEMARIIREIEPVKPSTRVRTFLGGTTLGGTGFQPVSADAPDDAAAQPQHHPQHRSQPGATPDPASPLSLAKCRQTDHKSLTKQLKGDLDWIVLKALEKDRKRRYESAGALSADVQRHLAGEAVLAAAPTVGYRARKFLGKHRVGVFATAAVVLAVLTGSIVATTGWIRADRALRELRKEQAIAAEISRLERLIGEAQFSRMSPRAVDRASEAVRGFESVLGPGDRRTLSARAVWANMYVAIGQQSQALPIYEQCFLDRRKYLGDGDPWTVGILSEIAFSTEESGDAEGGFRQWERAAEFARNHSPLGDITGDRMYWEYAVRLKNRGNCEEALPWLHRLRESLSHRPTPPSTAFVQEVETAMTECQANRDRASSPAEDTPTKDAPSP
jgi:serine/threonine protein kinase